MAKCLEDLLDYVRRPERMFESRNEVKTLI